MKKSILVIALVISSQLVLAWGKSGHIIVSKLADNYLTEKTKTSMQAILGAESIDEAGVWMDAVMNEKAYKNQANWHYVHTDVTLTENAQVKMQEFTDFLKTGEGSNDEKLLALRAIIHISGDIHVPLHCGSSKDKGGHKPPLKWAGSDEKTNLHKVWDSDMILKYQPDVDVYVKDLSSNITKEEQQTWGNIDFATWITESQEMLHQAYDFEGRELSEEYYNQNIVLVNDRLSMAGVRLAFLLNSIFDA